jgi:tryptophanyl-tRNA synthetase
MSKSLGEKHYIGLMEEPEAVWKKIRTAVTDTGDVAGQDMSPGVANLFELLRLSEAPTDVIDGFKQQHDAGEIRYGDLKTAVRDHLMTVLDPIRVRRAELSDDIVRDILVEGAQRAGQIAERTMAEVHRMIGVGAPGR